MHSAFCSIPLMSVVPSTEMENIFDIFLTLLTTWQMSLLNCVRISFWILCFYPSFSGLLFLVFSAYFFQFYFVSNFSKKLARCPSFAQICWQNLRVVQSLACPIVSLLRNAVHSRHIVAHVHKFQEDDGANIRWRRVHDVVPIYVMSMSIDNFRFALFFWICCRK